MPDLGKPHHGLDSRRPVRLSPDLPPGGSSQRVKTRRRLGLALGACALSVVTAVSTLGAPATTAAAAPVTPVSTRLAVGALLYETDAFAATNVQRVARGRVPLGPGGCLHKWAVRQARKMAERQEMFHQDLARVAKDCNLSYAGENVAYGYPSGTSVVRAWMASDGHRANILNRRYRSMGIGARKADGVWYVAQVFGRKAR